MDGRAVGQPAGLVGSTAGCIGTMAGAVPATFGMATITGIHGPAIGDTVLRAPYGSPIMAGTAAPVAGTAGCCEYSDRMAFLLACTSAAFASASNARRRQRGDRRADAALAHRAAPAVGPLPGPGAVRTIGAVAHCGPRRRLCPAAQRRRRRRRWRWRHGGHDVGVAPAWSAAQTFGSDASGSRPDTSASTKSAPYVDTAASRSNHCRFRYLRRIRSAAPSPPRGPSPATPAAVRARKTALARRLPIAVMRWRARARARRERHGVPPSRPARAPRRHRRAP